MSPDGRRSKRNVIHLIIQSLHYAFSRVAYLLLFLATFSYHVRLQNFTIRPIAAIARHADNPERVKTALEHFKVKKQKELAFVRPAVCVTSGLFCACTLVLIYPKSTLSAIAVIGIFSWQGIGDSFWVARVFLYWSLLFATFSLISSTVDQLLECIPGLDDETFYRGDGLSATLSLFVHTRTSNLKNGSESSPKSHKPKWAMAYVWQCPVMLMSWSWVYFTAGFVLHISTAVIPQRDEQHEVQVC